MLYNFFMLNPINQTVSTAHKNRITTNKEFLALSLPDVVFNMLIKVRMPTLIRRINFVLS